MIDEDQNAELNELEPAQAEPEAEAVELTPEEVEAQEAEAKQEAEQKAERKEEKRKRKEFFADKAKMESLEREVRRLRSGEAQAQGDDIEDVIESRARELVEERIRGRENEERAKKVTGVLSKASDYGDFDEAEFLSAAYKISDVMADAVLHSADGAQLAQYLYDDPDESERIYALSPYMQARELQKICDEFKAPAQAKKSGAPAPIRPVSGRSVATNELSDELPMAEWLERRNKQLYKR